MDTFWKKKPDKKGIPSGGKQKTKDHPVKKWLECENAAKKEKGQREEKEKEG